MQTVWKYAIAAGFIGLLPASFLFLMPLEVTMVYHLSIINRRPFSLGELGVIWGILLAASLLLAVTVGALFLALAPIAFVVWFAKAGFAFAFVLGFGYLVNWYYETENKKQFGQSPR